MTVNIPALRLEDSMSRQFLEKDAIYKLQTYLRAQRFIDEDFPLLPVDGIFDTQTKDALIEFQRKNGLNPTGTADRNTWDLLYIQYLDILKSNSLPSAIIPFPSYPIYYTIKIGEKSFLVATLQYMLNEISTVYNVFDPPQITGEYNKETEDVVRSFQERNLLEPTGEVDRRTWDFLSRIYNLTLHYIDQN